jgi:hypothetical protein
MGLQPDRMKIALLTSRCRTGPWGDLAGASPGPTNRTGEFQGSFHGPAAHPW